MITTSCERIYDTGNMRFHEHHRGNNNIALTDIGPARF